MEALIKHRALDYLVQHRSQTRVAPYSVATDVHATAMARAIGVPPHNLIHTLWDLQKRDYIRFRERKYVRGGVGGRGELDRFQVTGAGFSFWRDMAQSEAVMALASPDPSEVPDVVASVEAAGIAADIAEERRVKPHGSNGAAMVPIVPPTVGTGVDVSAFLSNVRGEEDPGEQAPSPVLAPRVPTLDPILSALLARYRARERVREAAAALEAAGMEDQALAVMEQATDNPVEDAMARHLLGCPYAREA